MNEILLVEPAYRSKFPPLGLMKISTYHKMKGDQVTFIRGKVTEIRNQMWNRIYISSLFTWELPRTVDTIKYYSKSIHSTSNIFVGGTGATLLPEYIHNNVKCTLIEGPLDKPGVLGTDLKIVANLVPDYSILEYIDYNYNPRDAYFTRITKGCIRTCEFCAVPILEKEFGFSQSLIRQIGEVDKRFGEKQNLVVMDNNILGIEKIEAIIQDIAKAGFEAGATKNGRFRTVDFNQGLDARLISKNPRLAELLATICVSPIRIAFDFPGIERAYRRAISLLTDQGFNEFTNYMLFNFIDKPEDLYERMLINAEINDNLGIRITGFPMRFIPMDDVRRNHVSKNWKWRYLRGIQCILLATHGLVSPNPEFIRAAFGSTFDEFIEILAMPDRYIIYREEYRHNGSYDWRSKYQRLSSSQNTEFLAILEDLNKNFRTRKQRIKKMRKYRDLLEHYYPGGHAPPRTPKDDPLLRQGV